MTNDTNTLNGALRELGETMAANLTQQGVTSTWDEGLTTLAAKILDITPGPGPTPTPSSILLTADKSILSYADSESATLSATVLDGSSNPLEDITVEFFKGSVSLGTATTNSSGIATKTYASAGVGDVSFTAEVGMISSETYSIEDCWLYHSQYSNDETLNITLPSDYTMTWKSTKTATYACFLSIGATNNNRVVAGVIGSNGLSGLWNSVNGTYTTQNSHGTITNNVERESELTVSGTTVTFTFNDITSSLTNVTHNLQNFLSVACRSSHSIRELKVKPLMV